MASDMGEKTEDATPRRLADARNRGQVAKSQDINAAVGLAVALILVLVFGPGIGQGLARLVRDNLVLDTFGSPIQTHTLNESIVHVGGAAALLVAPIFGLVFIFAYLTQLIQVGLLFTLKPVKPKLTQLNPVSGIKRIFGVRGLVRSGVNTLKLIVVIGIAWLIVQRHLHELVTLPRLDVFVAAAVIAKAAFELAIWLVVILLILALIDLIYQRWQHKRDLRMTKQEVKDERRSMEGDPQMKGKRLRMAREIAMQRIAQAVPKADVIIANPTHFSVAIRYDESTMHAPVVVAKGADILALRIRQLARFAGIPVIARPPLARALYWGIEVGQQISPEHYEAVAEILAYVYRLESEHKSPAAASA
jgi:flagellar biosynthetic protein FlhB